MKKWCFLPLVGLLFSISPHLVYAADSAPPTSAHTFTPSEPDGNHGWYVSPVQTEIVATDLESGVASLYWRIGDGEWEEEEFPESLNLAPNPSFETPGESQELASWEFTAQGGGQGMQADDQSYLGPHSAKIVAPPGGQSYWNNAEDYVVVTPWANMTAAVWVKTEAVVGSGAHFRVYALSPGGAIEITTSDSEVRGTSDWTRLSAEFSVSASDAYGLYLELGFTGAGTAWFDAVQVTEALTETSVEFTISQNGEFALEYYAVDRMGNEELPHPTVPLKIDTFPPGNWHDFKTYEWGDDHTLISEITVQDAVSKLDKDATAVQYSVDAGLNWGYYAWFLTCWEWTWVPNGWMFTISFPFWAPAGNEMRMMTLPIDYCDSDWSVCKMIRFRTADMAGNVATKDICINGAWFMVSGGGDVYAEAGIDMQAEGGSLNAEHLICTAGAEINNFSSEVGWEIRNYFPSLPKLSYAKWWERFSEATPITTLPTDSGVYLIDSDFEITAGSTIPEDLATSALGAVVFINGDLTINDDYFLGPEGALVLIVAGDVRIDKDVAETAGYFIVEGNVDTSYNSDESDTPWNLQGGMVADTFTLSRSLGGEGGNFGTPAEKIVFQPRYYVLLAEYFGWGRYSWREKDWKTVTSIR